MEPRAHAPDAAGGGLDQGARAPPSVAKQLHAVACAQPAARRRPPALAPLDTSDACLLGRPQQGPAVTGGQRWLSGDAEPRPGALPPEEGDREGAAAAAAPRSAAAAPAPVRAPAAPMHPVSGCAAPAALEACDAPPRLAAEGPRRASSLCSGSDGASPLRGACSSGGGGNAPTAAAGALVARRWLREAPTLDASPLRRRPQA
ncbi:hypothetical protein Rsub_07108 [Raphidocelis subcapitata]|uniref:Uncharacterized protein n=1 Tax=Raphidocelis subcapitata TaxID=307507 RepID=A0A2V0P2L7_9CHLO|nr:hypothetical protein Rsub_07108 [Raphidocelis subcapitata]|eukprot:GBF94121.1 hypothetical protein Rsub_07108 [Raphidocelis subcapitata]